MSANNYIPAGRTSLVEKDKVPLQVQTEYAHRPSPRITTTISRNGQVVHKVERSLDHPIGSPEEQTRAENTIRRQHAEVLSIIKSGSPGLTAQPKTVEQIESAEELPTYSVYDRLLDLPGVRRIYRLTNEGKFGDSTNESQFKQAYAAIFKSIGDLMNLFDRLPGVGYTRRAGVYEVERDRLYFASIGLECYFIIIGRVDYSLDYEQAIKSVIDKYT
jgi:hypothetical protein